jgi:hypothetical protein
MTTSTPFAINFSLASREPSTHDFCSTRCPGSGLARTNGYEAPVLHSDDEGVSRIILRYHGSCFNLQT